MGLTEIESIAGSEQMVAVHEIVMILNPSFSVPQDTIATGKG